MFYEVIIVRDERQFFLTSPAYGEFVLSSAPMNRYGFDSEESARLAAAPFLRPQDTLNVVRRYNV